MTRISEFPLPGIWLSQNNNPFDGNLLRHLHGVSGRRDKPEEIKIKKNMKKWYLEAILTVQKKVNRKTIYEILI